MKIYVDSEFKCHTANPDGEYREVNVNRFFNGKCAEFIEGYCYDDSNDSVLIYPFKPYDELDNIQREHEIRLLAEYAEALKIMGVTV